MGKSTPPPDEVWFGISDFLSSLAKLEGKIPVLNKCILVMAIVLLVPVLYSVYLPVLLAARFSNKFMKRHLGH